MLTYLQKMLWSHFYNQKRKKNAYKQFNCLRYYIALWLKFLFNKSVLLSVKLFKLSGCSKLFIFIKALHTCIDNINSTHFMYIYVCVNNICVH